ncbi:hypothetical protein HAP48_0042380 [Bradyrhizobium septentrionale]|uniref:Gp5/Type VI secretion system Vgr protein OB-fold domain-containing protein n=1 Tax=Bradyrhizobium septentrionale TaxID=1404411 RepID=A0A973W2G8_9BRAD|nr:hypothetical protein [Bradyrhizobium septentrionale]UGY15106.1 hypothetical protein HAP48_0042380 [Bradyrhizobium septentrionale]
MMGDGDLERVILGVVERWSASRYTERHGLVTSYDPKKHLAKVTFMPEGQESGWLPIETGHIGDGYGIAVGLQPGDGKTTGDQVVVRYQEGDFEGGKIVQRVHSDDQKPPEVQSGEMVIWTRFQKSDGGAESADGAQAGKGQMIYFKKDGSAVLTDGNGATITLDGNGNIKIACKDLEVDASANVKLLPQKNFIAKAGGDAGVGAGGNIEVQASGSVGLDAPGGVTAQGGGSVSDSSVSPPSSQPTIPPFTVPA